MTVTDIRRGLVQAADSYHEQAKTYGRVSRLDGAPFEAWCALMTGANFANTLAAVLRRIAEDHGEEYAAQVAEIVTAAEDDGEDAYFANDDVRMALAAVQPAATDGGEPA